MFFANQAVLTVTTDATNQYGSARQIYRSEGHSTQKPFLSLPSIIVISVLILLQIAGLLFLGVYNCCNPAWTGSLDAFAMARIGASLKPGSLPAIHSVGEKDMQGLHKIDGVICLESHVEDRDTSKSTPLIWHWGHGTGGTWDSFPWKE